MKQLLKHITKIVCKDDLVYFLGDVGYREAIANCLPRMNGRKILIKGNHDTYSKDFYLQYFEEVHSTSMFYKERIILSHRPLVVGDGTINIHGHTHMLDVYTDTHFNVCVEPMEYKPRRLEYFVHYALPNTEKPKHGFLEEWYGNILMPLEPREDLVLTADGLVDAEKTLERFKITIDI